MGEFNGKINAEFTPPKNWVLNKSLSFVTDELSDQDIQILKLVGANIDDTGRITCVKGMKTDLASVPRACWAFIAPWDVARAAVIHDHLYATLRSYNHSSGVRTPVDRKNKDTWEQARALSDKVFLLGMDSAEPKVPSWKKYSAYKSVRMFGRWPASAKE